MLINRRKRTFDDIAHFLLYVTGLAVLLLFPYITETYPCLLGTCSVYSIISVKIYYVTVLGSYYFLKI